MLTAAVAARNAASAATTTVLLLLESHALWAATSLLCVGTERSRTSDHFIRLNRNLFTRTWDFKGSCEYESNGGYVSSREYRLLSTSGNR